MVAVAVFATTASAAVPTVSIKASSNSITSGQTVTLTVTETSAASIHVTGSNGTSYTLPYNGGTLTVAPTSTTTYTAVATNSSGSASAQTTITVSSGTPAPTVSITAAKSSISPGTSDTLTVTASNATSVSVSGSDGSSYNLAASGGSITVTPSSTTTYTAKATGSSGTSASSSTTITVASGTNLPTISITASSTSINSGQSVTLTVTDTKTASVKVTGSNGTSYTLPYNGGSLSVAPTSTTTYTATATNSSGSTSAQVTITVGSTAQNPTVTISAQNSSINQGSSDVLTVTATNATSVVVTGSDGSSYPLSSTGGTVTVTPTMTTTYTAEASNAAGTTASAQTTVTVGTSTGGDVTKVKHVIFMLQENRSFDSYFGMLNPYRHSKGWDIGDDGKTYVVDGIEDKLNTIFNKDDEGDTYYLYKFRTTCIDDDSSDWLASYGSVNRYNFLTTRPINMDGFVHTAEGFAKSCASSGKCSGAYTDLTGERAMGYYDQDFLNYYYYMASQFAVSDRWFSPISSKSTPNRIATFAGGTTQGLAYDRGLDDHVGQEVSKTIFQELNEAGVSWKIYYQKTSSAYPDTMFSQFSWANNFLYHKTSTNSCTGTTQPSSVVGDSTNSFCIDPNHLAPISRYFTDLTNNTLPAFAFIEAGGSDEHPGSNQSILSGQSVVANIINKFMASSSWQNSVFFFSYDEGGGPYDHVPPVPGHSNQNTDASLGSIPDISSIAVNPDGYNPCLPPTLGQYTLHCDLRSSSPGAHSGDAAAVQGFKAQLGFRVPNIIISPFTRKHYVSHTPMDHTAVIKFVESRFISPSAHLTNRDAAQPNLLEFFDFNAVPWSTPPAPPTPASISACQPASMGP
ncbi:MAG TPA: alkaline phosphatase family protein [Terracidiphilus sp.]|nr:alkaline phosphatase family protein [Terracidiphilus sp.]